MRERADTLRSDGQCGENTVQLFEGVGDQIYSIDKSNTWMDLKPRYAISDKNCPMVCSLYRDGEDYDHEEKSGVKFDESSG